jgi:hypothetical protein
MFQTKLNLLSISTISPSEEKKAAVQYWLDKVNPPKALVASLRKKLLKYDNSPEAIRADADSR